MPAPITIWAIAASVGAPVWFLSVGLGWPQLGTDEYPWHANTRVFRPAKFGAWDAVMPRFAGELAAFAVK